MIDPKELRQGNILKQGTVASIYLDGIGLNDGVYNPADVDPIALTPEWLERFGWVWNDETDTFEKYPKGRIPSE